MKMTRRIRKKRERQFDRQHGYLLLYCQDDDEIADYWKNRELWVVEPQRRFPRFAGAVRVFSTAVGDVLADIIWETMNRESMSRRILSIRPVGD